MLVRWSQSCCCEQGQGAGTPEPPHQALPPCSVDTVFWGADAYPSQAAWGLHGSLGQGAAPFPGASVGDAVLYVLGSLKQTRLCDELSGEGDWAPPGGGGRPLLQDGRVSASWGASGSVHYIPEGGGLSCVCARYRVPGGRGSPRPPPGRRRAMPSCSVCTWGSHQHPRVLVGEMEDEGGP